MLTHFLLVFFFFYSQIFLPDPVTNRSRHSMSAFSVSRNFVRIMVHGGVSSSRDFVSGPNLLMVVELGIEYCF